MTQSNTDAELMTFLDGCVCTSNPIGPLYGAGWNGCLIMLQERLPAWLKARSAQREAPMLGASNIAGDLGMLLSQSVQAVKNMMPEQREEMFKQQRASWVRGEMVLGPENGTAAAPTPPQPGDVERFVDGLVAASKFLLDNAALSTDGAAVIHSKAIVDGMMKMTIMAEHIRRTSASGDEVERVARAICVAQGYDPDLITALADDTLGHFWKARVHLAIAALGAIAAMRPPEPVMPPEPIWSTNTIRRCLSDAAWLTDEQREKVVSIISRALQCPEPATSHHITSQHIHEPAQMVEPARVGMVDREALVTFLREHIAGSWAYVGNVAHALISSGIVRALPGREELEDWFARVGDVSADRITALLAFLKAKPVENQNAHKTGSTPYGP